MTCMDTKQETRWYRPAPAWLVYGSLLVTGLLFASNCLSWPAWHKGYAVLVAVAGVGGMTLLMVAWFGVALLFRRRFQFGIRTLLMLTLAAALPFSWLAVQAKYAKCQKNAAQAIRRMDGSVCYDYQFEDRDAAIPWPKWLIGLLDVDFFSDVVGVEFDVRYENRLVPPDQRSGRGIFVGSIYLTEDDGMIFPKLTDAEFGESVKGLPRLEVLTCRHADVTDGCLAHLKGLAHLRKLHLLFAHGVSDAGLEYLKGLTQLKDLQFYDTEVTVAGLKDLQRALPNCEICY